MWKSNDVSFNIEEFPGFGVNYLDFVRFKMYHGVELNILIVVVVCNVYG